MLLAAARQQSAEQDDATGGTAVGTAVATAAPAGQPATPDDYTFVDASSHAREEFDEPAAHSYFDQGPTFGHSNFGEDYADGFLEGQMQYQVGGQACISMETVSLELSTNVVLLTCRDLLTTRRIT